MSFPHISLRLPARDQSLAFGRRVTAAQPTPPLPRCPPCSGARATQRAGLSSPRALPYAAVLTPSPGAPLSRRRVPFDRRDSSSRSRGPHHRSVNGIAVARRAPARARANAYPTGYVAHTSPGRRRCRGLPCKRLRRSIWRRGWPRRRCESGRRRGPSRARTPSPPGRSGPTRARRTIGRSRRRLLPLARWPRSWTQLVRPFAVHGSVRARPALPRVRPPGEKRGGRGRSGVVAWRHPGCVRRIRESPPVHPVVRGSSVIAVRDRSMHPRRQVRRCGVLAVATRRGAHRDHVGELCVRIGVL